MKTQLQRIMKTASVLVVSAFLAFGMLYVGANPPQDTPVFAAATQTLTNKTLTAPAATSPVLTTSLILNQTTEDYTLTWDDPAAARAIVISDPLGADVFAWRDATQILLAKTLVNPIAVSPNPLEGALSSSPRWLFKQVDFGDMTAAATADTFVLLSLPANTMIHDVVGNLVTPWAGGTISAAVCSVGTAAGTALDLALDDDMFAAAGERYQLHDATASGGKGALLFDATDKFAPTFAAAAGDIEIQCDLTGDDHANATAGSLEVYVQVSQPFASSTEAN